MSNSTERIRRANATLTLLRRHIVSGHFPPGKQLPTRRELQRTLGVSPVTLQRALDRLTEEGFVYSRGRGGSFVMDNPPHLSRIALVFMQTPSNDVTQWSILSRLMANEAPVLAERRNRKVSLHYGIDGHSDNEDFLALSRDVRAGRVAGLLFATNPYPLVNTPLMEEPGMPRVAVTGRLMLYPGVESVTPDWESFITRALAHFAQRGRKRVAMLLTINMADEWTPTIEKKLAEFNLESRPYWQLALNTPLSVRNCLHLMLNPNQNERPDALIVCSDGWTEHAIAGLITAGVRIPDELDVIFHCNFPAMVAPVLPIRRLGWEVRSFLDTAVDLLEAQRATGKIGEGRKLSAIFEDEIEASTAHGASLH